MSTESSVSKQCIIHSFHFALSSVLPRRLCLACLFVNRSPRCLIGFADDRRRNSGIL